MGCGCEFVMEIIKNTQKRHEKQDGMRVDIDGVKDHEKLDWSGI